MAGLSRTSKSFRQSAEQASLITRGLSVIVDQCLEDLEVSRRVQTGLRASRAQRVSPVAILRVKGVFLERCRSGLPGVPQLVLATCLRCCSQTTQAGRRRH